MSVIGNWGSDMAKEPFIIPMAQSMKAIGKIT